MSAEATLRRLINENRQSREVASNRLRRLTEVTVNGSDDEFQRITREILGFDDHPESREFPEAESDPVLGSDGQAEVVVRSDRSDGP